MTPAQTVISPSWRRVLFAFALALTGFCLPQKIPLEWYPLNEPGNDIYYLEITCAADRAGEIKISYTTGNRESELNTIRFPVSATAATYTYTFPLPDAPISDLKLMPVRTGGSLTIRQMRIVDRGNIEIQRFTREMFKPVFQIASVLPLPDGWKITSEINSQTPVVTISLAAPILAKGINHRNFLRCLYSSSYLAFMIWLLLLALTFAFYRPQNWREAIIHCGFMAVLAVQFSIVGNRGLIKNSIRYSLFQPPALKAGFNLEFDLRINRPATAQLFWDSGSGFNEKESVRVPFDSTVGLQTLRFSLPRVHCKALRFDPVDGQDARLTIRGIRVVDMENRTVASLPLSSLEPSRDIDSYRLHDNLLEITTSSSSNDPILIFKQTEPAQVGSIP